MADTPVPVSTTPALYPPNSRDSGVAIVEVHVKPSGDVDEATVVSSAPGFDASAVDAAKQWRFRPSPDAVDAYAYIVFAFRQPITGR
jgi:TonB family protein